MPEIFFGHTAYKYRHTIAGVDETGVDETGVDEKRVDETSSRRNRSRRTRYTPHSR